MTDLLEELASLPTPLVLLVAGTMAFSETGIGLGFFVPGETGVLVMATTVTSPGSFAAMATVVWLSAAAGDSFGYVVGRRYGSQVPETRLGRRLGEEKWERSQELLHRYGARAVVTSRFLPAVRVVTPVAAGTMHLPIGGSWRRRSGAPWSGRSPRWPSAPPRAPPSRRSRKRSASGAGCCSGSSSWR